MTRQPVLPRAQASNGGAIYLRLTTKSLQQPDRDLGAEPALSSDIVRGGYWHVRPSASTTHVIAFCGVTAGAAIEAKRSLGESVALLQITSYETAARPRPPHAPTHHPPVSFDSLRP